MADGDEEDGKAMFDRACALMDAGDYANAMPVFEEVQTRSDVTAKGYDSCNGNIAQCASHTGDHQKVLTYTALFLESSMGATLDAGQRAAHLELFYAAYKSQSGISYHNPFNEY
jgi:hypothetical protein